MTEAQRQRYNDLKANAAHLEMSFLTMEWELLSDVIELYFQ
jgi:hypothetical protein